MTDRKQEILQDLADAVVSMDEELTVQLAHEAIALGIDAFEAIQNGLTPGMDRVSELYDREEYFVPEILLCSDAMYAAIDVLKPYLKVDESAPSITVVIGVIEGDTHDIGKNIVRIMMETAGLNVIDLGRDVAVENFIETAVSNNADVIALSTLMSTTRGGMRRLVSELNARGLRDRFRVLIGGPPCSGAFAQDIGADAFGATPGDGIRFIKQWAGKVQCSPS